MAIGNDLRRMIDGRILEPGDDGFEQARRPWNLAIDQPVRAVVEPADADYMAALVKYARRNGLTITAQPSGHGASGDTGDAILLRTCRLGEIEGSAGRPYRPGRCGRAMGTGAGRGQPARADRTGGQ